MALVLRASLAWAQSDTATISGRITDQSGDVIAGASVQATNVDTGVTLPVQSSLDGIYVAANLRPGRYRLVVERPGFTTIALEDLTLAVQDVLGRNFTMQISPQETSVTVTAGPAEKSLSPAVSTVVDRQFVEHLPLNGRSFQSLLQLTPGALVSAAGQGIEGQLTVNGQRTNTNYFTVDGVTANFAANISVNLGQNVGGTLPAFTIAGGTNSFVSVDAMQEFRTQTSTYSPEFGRQPGAQIAIVTKSGTNEFHGTLYDYVRNEALDARNWFNPEPAPEPPLRQHNFGGTLGGPVRRNSGFFFFSYEGLRLEQPVYVSANFYTPETRAAVAPVYRPLVDALPVPNGPLLDPTCDNVSRPCLASLTGSYGNPTSFDSSSLRFDQAITERLSVLARVSHTPSSTESRSFSGVTTASRDTSLATTGLTAILSSSLLNDFRLGWSRSTGNVSNAMDDAYGAVPPPISSLFPRGTTPESHQQIVVLPNGSVGVGTRADNAARQINVVDTFSVLAGAHHLKLGLDYRHFQPSSTAASGNLLIVNDFSLLRSGTMGPVSAIASEAITLSSHNWSVFAQDTWQSTDRLTVTYGLRWDVNTPPVSITPGKPLYAIEGIFDSKSLQLAPPGTPLWRTRYNSVAPRLGAAYQLDSSTIVRGGAGLFHDLGYGRFLGSLINGFPYLRTRTTSASGQPFDLNSPLFDPLPISTSLSAFTQGSLVAFDPNLQVPMTVQWNGALERALGGSQSLSVTYVGANGRRLLRPDFVVPPALRAQGSPPVAVTRNAGYSHYNALQLQFTRRLSRGLQALASYTLAQSSDTESDDGGGNFFGAAHNSNSAVSLSQIQLPALAPSDFDVRHALSAAVSYDIPAPAVGSIARTVLEDWSVDAIVRISSPMPLDVRMEGVSPVLGVYKTQPDLVPGQPIWLTAPDQPGGRILNPDAFTLPPVGEPGNFPRNSIRSPFRINQTDLAFRRQFALTQGTSLEFRAEFFNLFNTPMFGGFSAPVTFWGRCASTPCTGKQNAAFGKVTTGYTLNQGLGGDPLSGGQSAIYATGGARSIQLSLKLRF